MRNRNAGEGRDLRDVLEILAEVTVAPLVLTVLAGLAVVHAWQVVGGWLQ